MLTSSTEPRSGRELKVPIGLTLFWMILNYWVIHMSCSVELVMWGNQADEEGLCWYDGYNASFWYFLNVEWYRMNDKLYAKLTNEDRFEIHLLRDYDEENINRYGQCLKLLNKTSTT